MKLFLAAGLEALQLVVESRRVGLAADLDDHVVVVVGLFARRRRLALDVERHGVAVLDAASFDRLEPRRAALQLASVFSTASSSSVTAGRRSEIVFQRARIDRRQRLERGGKCERLTFVERHVLHVRRVDGLEAALAQRFVDGARNEIVRDVVENLLAEPLLDERRRNLALTESGNARLPAVAARHAVDLGVDDVAGNFDGDALLGLAEIGEFGFHY